MLVFVVALSPILYASHIKTLSCDHSHILAFHHLILLPQIARLSWLTALLLLLAISSDLDDVLIL